MADKKQRKDGKTDRKAESQRILKRVSRESEGSAMLGRARDHLAASDTDKSDPVELWGTRIARALAIVAVIVLILWLIGFLTRG